MSAMPMEELPVGNPWSPPTMQMILALMNFQQVRVNNRVSSVNCESARWEDYFSTFESIPRHCASCLAPIDPDPLPRFLIRHPETYVIR